MNASSSSSRSTRKEESRDRILDVASRTVRRAGFDGVGVADVMKQAGLTHGGFYAHFPSRDDLLIAAAVRAGQDSRQVHQGHVDRLIAAGVPPFRAVVETYLHEAGLDDIECGCPVAALVSEMPRQSSAVQDEGRSLVLQLQRMVSEALGPDAPAEAAWPIAATLIGALQLARAVGDRDQALAILASTKRSLLAQHTEAAQPARSARSVR
ncbi:TetR/AcrR family transcriptional regulator [Roseateles noduli]|uniref:TetR/AcrR family transcriptional regulator n=1 Tax=Roseateles noduli TaxID=2052484 RepID=UPI003D65D338